MEQEILDITKKIEGASEESRKQATEHIEKIAMPPWALGRLLDLAVDIAGIQHEPKPHSGKKRIFTMASDHAVATEGVSPWPQDVTLQMAGNILLGGAGVSVLARQAGADVQLVDMGIKEDITNLPGAEKLKVAKVAGETNNIHQGPAMTREEAVQSIINAYNIVSDAIENEDIEIIGTGELGIGNSTPATAILAVLTDTPVEEITGRGSGLNDEGLKEKIRILKEVIKTNKPDKNDAIDVLAKVGGYDIAGIAGTCLAAAAHNKPVIVDGFISTAGALIAYAIEPKTADYMIPSHRSVEVGHDKMWETLGKEPLLDLNLRLGEGTGGALAMQLVDAACAVANEMITFEEGGVSDSETASIDNFD